MSHDGTLYSWILKYLFHNKKITCLDANILRIDISRLFRGRFAPPKWRIEAPASRSLNSPFRDFIKTARKPNSFQAWGCMAARSKAEAILTSCGEAIDRRQRCRSPETPDWSPGSGFISCFYVWYVSYTDAHPTYVFERVLDILEYSDL